MAIFPAVLPETHGSSITPIPIQQEENVAECNFAAFRIHRDPCAHLFIVTL